MGNTNKPFGLRLVGTLSGSPFNAAIRKFYTANATAFYVGDTVKLDGTAGVVNTGDSYMPGVEKAATGDTIIGVVLGFEPIPTNLSLNYHTANTAQYCYVCVDPHAIYEIQGDSTVWAITDVGSNAALTVSTGVTATGISNAVATSPTTTASTGAADPFQIVGIVPSPDNAVGAYMRMLVKLNLHQYANAAVGK